MQFGTGVNAVTEPWPADLTGIQLVDQDNDGSPA